MQLAQAQILKACLIVRIFKTMSIQALNVKTYLTSIGFESNKKAN